MPTFYNFRQDGVDYSFDDVFVPADMFREGNLWVWGSAFSGVLGTNDNNITKLTPVTTFSGGANWKSIGRGLHVMGGIKSDGTLWNTGRGASGDLGHNSGARSDTFVTTFAGGTNWKQVDYFVGTGAAHGGISVKTDGTLWVWGDNAYGTLGTNDTGTSRFTPVTTFAGGTNWKQVAGGQHFVGAIKTDGTLWVWGRNQAGQLGTNDTTNRSTPVTTFAGGTDWKQIGLGASATHISAIKTDGTLWTWGGNFFGGLGTNDTTDRLTPVTTFAGGTNWKQTNAGSGFTAAIKTDGTLWSWGSVASLGRLNDGTRLTPVTTFAGGTNWADTPTSEPDELYTLSGGQSHTAAIKTDGTLWTWGGGSTGQLGTNNTISISIPVTTFAGGTNWKQVSVSGLNMAAIKTDGTLWTWGGNFFGGLGTNDTTDRLTPVTTFAGGTNWKQVSSGQAHTAAIKTDGTLWTWGYNGSFTRRLGTNDTTDRLTPVTTFAGGTNWKQVSTSFFHTAAIKEDGTLWTWGYNGTGQLGTNNTTTPPTPVTTFAGGTNWKQVSGGANHTAAIKTDGTLWTWGFGGTGQLGNGITTGNISTPVTTFAGGTNWKQVSSAGAHTAAIKTDGTLWTWGSGTSGQLGTNDTTNRSTPVTTFAGGTNWKQVSGAQSHTAALSDDGTNKELYLFGSNASFQLGIYTDHIVPGQVFGNSTNWKQISTNTNSCAIKTDGTLWTWGSAGTQLGINISLGRNTPVTTFLGGSNWKQCDHGAGMVAITYDDPVL
jgi:alpha-tubulin suppressor-like RCC1 family protein